MSWKYFNYGCSSCEHVYSCLVGSDEKPDPCPQCGSADVSKTFGSLNQIKTYVPDYPGANYHRAGYAELRRPAEKAGRQISMAGVKASR